MPKYSAVQECPIKISSDKTRMAQISVSQIKLLELSSRKLRPHQQAPIAEYRLPVIGISIKSLALLSKICIFDGFGIA